MDEIVLQTTLWSVPEVPERDQLVDLKAYFEAEKTSVDVQTIALLSAEPPSFLELISTVATWLKWPVTAYLSAYLATIGKAHAENRKEHLKALQQKAGPAIAKVRGLVAAIRRTALDSRRRSNFNVTIGTFKVRIQVPFRDEDEAIDTVARSIGLFQKVESVLEEIKDRIDPSDRLMGRVSGWLTPEGFKLRWTRQRGNHYEHVERQFDHSGNPLSDEYNPPQKKPIDPIDD